MSLGPTRADRPLSSTDSCRGASALSTSLPLPCLSACSLSTRPAKAADSKVKPFFIEQLPPSVLAFILQGKCEELVGFCSTNRAFRDVVCQDSGDMQSLWNYALDVRGWNHLWQALRAYSTPKGAKDVFVRLCKIEPRLPSGWAANFHVTQVAMLLAALEHDNVPVTTKGYLIESTDLAVASLCRLESSGKLLSWPTEGAPAGMHPCTFEATFADPSLFESLGRGIPYGNQQRTIAASAFADYRSLDLKVLPDSITRIENKAFFMCSNLSLTKLPTSLESIGISTFESCENLSMKHLPEGLRTIGAAAFKDCHHLKLESLPCNLHVLPELCFSSTRVSLTTLPESLTEIHTAAFSNCRLLALTDISQVQVLKKAAFLNCPALKTLQLNSSLRTIPEMLFAQCVGLHTVSLPARLERIEEAAFEGCPSINFDSLPKGVQVLSQRCFAECSSLSLESLPVSVTEVHQQAFWGCSKLKLKDASSVRVWGRAALGACPTLQRIELNGELETIAQELFAHCAGLQTVTLPPRLQRIEENAFAVCKSLDFEVLPSTLRVLSKRCFAECGSLSLKSLPEGVTDILEDAFGGCSMLKLTAMPNVRVLGQHAFRFCEQLQTLILGSELRVIPKGAFFGCSSLESVTLPNQLTDIKDTAFAYCSKLTRLELPSSLEFVGREAFRSCISLRVEKLPEKLLLVGDGAFSEVALVNWDELRVFWDRTQSLPQNESRTIDDMTTAR